MKLCRWNNLSPDETVLEQYIEIYIRRLGIYLKDVTDIQDSASLLCVTSLQPRVSNTVKLEIGKEGSDKYFENG